MHLGFETHSLVFVLVYGVFGAPLATIAMTLFQFISSNLNEHFFDLLMLSGKPLAPPTSVQFLSWLDFQKPKYLMFNKFRITGDDNKQI